MRFAFHTNVGRFAVLAVAVAIIAGGVWSWRTSPWYLIPDRYFVTYSPQETVLQRDGKPFDAKNSYHLSLLVSSELPMPFGVDPDINSRLMQRGLNGSSRLDEIDAKMYSQNCGFPLEQGKPRVNWKGTRLCNTGNLDGELWRAAVQVFHEKVDDEISGYWLSLAKNAADKIGKCLLVAIGLIGLLAAGLWVTRGKLI
jgi:hypothetical protein